MVYAEKDGLKYWMEQKECSGKEGEFPRIPPLGYNDFTHCFFSIEKYMNDAVHNLHRSLVASRPNVNTFEFSAKDIYNTMAAIQKVIEDSNNYNQIIVPMNTKMSTLAIGMIALENPQIQLCYAEPETYNYENYSSCGNSVMIYTWDDLSNSGE